LHKILLGVLKDKESGWLNYEECAKQFAESILTTITKDELFFRAKNKFEIKISKN